MTKASLWIEGDFTGSSEPFTHLVRLHIPHTLCSWHKLLRFYCVLERDMLPAACTQERSISQAMLPMMGYNWTAVCLLLLPISSAWLHVQVLARQDVLRIQAVVLIRHGVVLRQDLLSREALQRRNTFAASHDSYHARSCA